jgi:altronate dehydratase large subunit
VTATLRGHRRGDARLGARNHILVLPSVVCADQTASLIGSEPGAIAVVHQHGCGQVGDDVAHTERAFVGFATNPNVGAVVVVSLGCETIQGRRLAGLIEGRGQRLEFVGIQQLGGTFNTVDRGREAVVRLRARLDEDRQVDAGIDQLVLGIAADGPGPAAHELAELATSSGASVVVAVPEHARSDWGSAPGIDYGEPAPSGLALVEHGGEGAEQHLALAGAGAQVIVSLRGPGRPPQGFATGPVIAVAGDPGIYAALEDDFDLDGSSAGADAVWRKVIDVFNGELTASERRGARDFVLHRIARTM